MGFVVGCSSRRQSASLQVVLRRHAECVRDAVEKREHGDHIDGFRNLIFGPAGVAQLLNVRHRGSVSRFGDELRVIEQRTLRRRKAGFVEFAFQDCRYALVCGSLNTQEVGMAVQSIRAPV